MEVHEISLNVKDSSNPKLFYKLFYKLNPITTKYQCESFYFTDLF